MRRRNRHHKDTVMAMVKALAKRLSADGVFHIGEMIAAVLRHIPDASPKAIYASVWHLTHTYGFLENPRRELYKLRTEIPAPAIFHPRR